MKALLDLLKDPKGTRCALVLGKGTTGRYEHGCIVCAFEGITPLPEGITGEWLEYYTGRRVTWYSVWGDDDAKYFVLPICCDEDQPCVPSDPRSWLSQEFYCVDDDNRKHYAPWDGVEDDGDDDEDNLGDQDEDAYYPGFVQTCSSPELVAETEHILSMSSIDLVVGGGGGVVYRSATVTDADIGGCRIRGRYSPAN
jgi:hypothetical protein